MKISNLLGLQMKTALFVVVSFLLETNVIHAAQTVKGVNLLADKPTMLAAFINDQKYSSQRSFSEKPERSSWAFYFDNDILALGQRDRDYTGGMSITLSGEDAATRPFSVDFALGALNNWIGIEKPNAKILHSFEFGMTAFTPENIRTEQALFDDRPYASLIYVSNTKQYVDVQNKSSIITSLTLGVLGLDLTPRLQRQIHKVTGSKQARGWKHQISAGGELTFRYSVSKQKIRWSSYSRSNHNYEVKTANSVSLGYLTEASWSISGRYGKLRSPWSTFNPQNVTYSEKNLPLANSTSKPKNEFYVWAGLSIHARAYNAFLQGQFRSSDVTYKSEDLKKIVNEAWLGVTKELCSGYRLSYFLRGQSAEIEYGPGSRNPVWGGIIISHSV